MKGVAYWFWIAGGVIGGLIIFTLAYQQIVGMQKTADEQRSLEQFDEVKNIINNLCWSFSGNKREYTITLSENIEGIYVAESKYEGYEAEDLVDMILSTKDVTGNYLCIKVKGKRFKCEELECNTTMPVIGAVPEEFSLIALINNLMGKGKTFDYSLEFERMENNVTVRITS